MLELVLLGGFAAYNMATTHSDDHTSQQGDRKIDCYDIWDKITHGPGTGSIQDGQAAASRLKGAYSDRQSTVGGRARESDAAGTGGGPGGGPGGVNLPGPGGGPSFPGQPPNIPGGGYDPSKVPGGG